MQCAESEVKRARETESTTLEEYENIKYGKLLGEGSFGKVYLATRNEKPVIVKKFQLATLKKDGTADVYRTKIRTEDFLYEALAQLVVEDAIKAGNVRRFDIVSAFEHNIFITKHFQGIIIFDFDTTVAMDMYINDNTVEKNAEYKRKALRMIRTLMSSISNLHDAGIVHLDLKPNNLLIVWKKLVSIIDLGLVCAEPKVIQKISPLFSDLKRRLKFSLERKPIGKPENFLFAEIRATILHVLNDPTFGTNTEICIKDHESTPMYRNPELQKDTSFLGAKQRDLFSIGIIAYELYEKKLFYGTELYNELYKRKKSPIESDGETVRAYIQQNPITENKELNAFIQACMLSETIPDTQAFLSYYIKILN